MYGKTNISVMHGVCVFEGSIGGALIASFVQCGHNLNHPIKSDARWCRPREGCSICHGLYSHGLEFAIGLQL